MKNRLMLGLNAAAPKCSNKVRGPYLAFGIAAAALTAATVSADGAFRDEGWAARENEGNHGGCADHG